MLWAFHLLLTAYCSFADAAPQRSLILAQSYTTTTGEARTLTSSIVAGATGGAIASTTPDSDAQVNCTAIDNVFDQSCWGTLNLTEYLTHWNQTVKRCRPLAGDDGADCCVIDEPWTTCFLRLGHHASVSLDCTTITSSGCIYNGFMDVDVSIRPQVHYIMKNIYSINEYFTAYWTALQYSISQAHLIIHSVVILLDPEHKTNMLLGDILSSLSFALAFIALPEAEAIYKGTAYARLLLAGSFMVIATQETPMLLRAAFPRGMYTTRQFQIGEFSEGLTEISKQVQGVLEEYLRVLMTDVPAFLAFARSGFFSGKEEISVPQQTKGLDLALKSYVITKAMTENRWFVSYDLTSNYEDVPIRYNCEYDQNGLCGETTYYSNFTGITYFLANAIPSDQDLPVRNLLAKVINNDWTHPGFIFDAAFNCTASGAMMEDNNDPEGYTMFSFKDNKFNLACASQLVVCKPCRAQCPTALVDGVCPFQSCPPSKSCLDER